MGVIQHDSSAELSYIQRYIFRGMIQHDGNAELSNLIYNVMGVIQMTAVQSWL